MLSSFAMYFIWPTFVIFLSCMNTLFYRVLVTLVIFDKHCFCSLWHLHFFLLQIHVTCWCVVQIYHLISFTTFALLVYLFTNCTLMWKKKQVKLSCRILKISPSVFVFVSVFSLTTETKDVEMCHATTTPNVFRRSPIISYASR